MRVPAERLSGGGDEAGEEIESTSARVWSMRRTSARTLSSTSWKAPWCQCGCPGSRRNASRRGADDTAAAAARRRRRRRKTGGPIMDGGSGETLGQGFWKLRRRSLLEREGAGKAEEGRRTGSAAAPESTASAFSPFPGVVVALRLVMF
jgi:hypothetical protein